MAVTANVREFNLQVAKEAKEIAGEFQKLKRTVSLDALTRLVQKTPVDTGRARGNWQVAGGAPKTSKIERNDQRGSDVISTEIANIPKDGFDTVWLTNNVEYIEDLEMGTSRQAPNGMLALTFAELQAIYG